MESKCKTCIIGDTDRRFILPHQAAELCSNCRRDLYIKLYLLRTCSYCKDPTSYAIFSPKGVICLCKKCGTSNIQIIYNCVRCNREALKNEEYKLINIEMDGTPYELYVWSYCSLSCLSKDKRSLSDLLETKQIKSTTLLYCQRCGKGELKMKKCGGCRNAYYCSADCQREDWMSHKPICKSI